MIAANFFLVNGRRCVMDGVKEAMSYCIVAQQKNR